MGRQRRVSSRRAKLQMNPRMLQCQTLKLKVCSCTMLTSSAKANGPGCTTMVRHLPPNMEISLGLLMEAAPNLTQTYLRRDPRLP